MLGCALAATTGGRVRAQRATESAIGQADDAFGATVGQESTGIYTETDIRGFNPQLAGNTRIDNAYFDQLALFPLRVRDKATIRVGFAAQDYFAPAPTGIYAYHLRRPQEEAVATVGVHAHYGGMLVEVDSLIPVVPGRFGVALGASSSSLSYADSSHARYRGAGMVMRMRFGEVEVKPLVALGLGYRIDTRPIVTSSGGYLPPEIKEGRYLGQKWADNHTDNITYGVVAGGPVGHGVGFQASAIRSLLRRVKNYSEIFALQQPDGLSRHTLLSDPRHDNYADSFEGQLNYRFERGDSRHQVLAGVRERRRRIHSGGSARFDFGTVVLGERDPEAEPAAAFGPMNVGRLRQTTYSAGYIGRYRRWAQVNLGLSRVQYRAAFLGSAGASRASAESWLGNASLMVRPSPGLSFYVGWIKGLEDSGSAPENAANRNQQLPAARTRQIDGGVKVQVGAVQLVSSVFQIEKPYFSFDTANTFVEFGTVRHRGLELSAAGNVTERLRLVGGAVLMDPVVTGPARRLGLVGKQPVGVTKLHLRADASWRAPWVEGLAATVTFFYDAKRAASAVTYAGLGDRQLFTPARATFDIGAKYSFQLGDKPASFRVVVNNITNRRGWKVLSSNLFQRDDYRRLTLDFTVDY